MKHYEVESYRKNVKTTLNTLWVGQMESENVQQRENDCPLTQVQTNPKSITHLYIQLLSTNIHT